MMGSESRNVQPAEYAERRNEVEGLLNRGTDEKLQRANTKSALESIESAYERAKGLGFPWPQVTAYRLAHLMFRSPEPDLKRVRELFREAMKVKNGVSLGPMPKIYEIAVLHRMNSEDEEIEACFEGAIALIRQLASDRRLESESNDGDYRTAIQDCAVNLVELSAYFLRLPHDDLLGLTPEGSSKVFAGLGIGKSSWKVVGRDPGLEKISYPRALAEVELEELGRQHNAVLVKFSEDESSAVWRFPTQLAYSPISDVLLQELAPLLKLRPRRLHTDDSNSGDEGDRSRTRRRRLRVELREGLHRDLAFDPIPAGEKTLHGEISWFAMTPASMRRCR